MTEMFFEDAIDDSKYMGHLYGLGTSWGADQSPLSPTTTTVPTTLREQREEKEEEAME